MKRFLTILLVAGCNSQQPKTEANASSVDKPDTSAVNAAIAQYRSALNSGDSTAFYALVSDSVELLPPGMGSVRGADARALFRGLFTDVKPDLGEFKNQEIILSGDWAIQRYDFTLATTPKAGGAITTESGSGVHIWHHDADGKWRIRKDIWTSKAAS